jgi:hypothetical protein
VFCVLALALCFGMPLFLRMIALTGGAEDIADYIAEHPHEPLATLRGGQSLEWVLIKGASGRYEVAFESGEAQLPAGRWVVEAWRISAASGTGKWRAVGGIDGGRKIDLPAGEVVNVDFGEPLRAECRASRGGAYVHFSQSLKGADGALVQLARNGSLPPPPRLKITNADGTYDRTFNFAYG